MFYPEDDEGAERAKRVCAGCQVQSSCLDHALSFREKAGVWGGATERDRRRMIRQRRRIS
jgi:WhiB family redox-sensing transcriptional regulator